MIATVLSSAIGIRSTDLNKGYPGKSITETIINGFFTVDRHWTVKYWNKAAEKILGIPAEDIIGKNLWDKFAGILPVDFYTVYHKAFLQDIPVRFEEYWGEMGAWFNVITYYHDKTLSVSFKSSNRSIHPAHSKNPGQHLQIINELYRFVTEVTNDCLWEWDFRAGELFWIDGGHKRIFGYDIENALIPQSFWESCVHPDDKERILTRLNKFIAEKGGQVWEDEYRFKRANGEYAYVHDRGHIIYDAENNPSRMIGATQDITEKALLEQKLAQERQSGQREITDAVLTALENERANIGKELHDNLGQILAATKMYLQMAIKSEKKRVQFLEKSSGFVSDVISEIRKISKKLVIPGIHIIGLSDNIRILIHDLSLVDPLKIEFRDEGIKYGDLNEKLQFNIFRIIQEHLNNILNHANASYAVIKLTRLADEVILRISDNGEGYNLLTATGGVGIINIKSRADLCQGTVTVTSEPGQGYELKVALPLTHRPV